MGEKSDEIVRQIDRTRGELGENLQELESKVKDVADWRKQFQKSPLTMIGIAFGGGVLLSRVVGGSSPGRRRYRAEDWDNASERHGRAENAGTRHEMKKAADTWDNIKGALIGVAANKVQEFLGGAVPGFHEEYSKVQTHKAPEHLEHARTEQPAPM